MKKLFLKIYLFSDKNGIMQSRKDRAENTIVIILSIIKKRCFCNEEQKEDV